MPELKRSYFKVAVLSLLLSVFVFGGVAQSAPIEGKPSMADLTNDDKKPLQLSARADIKHDGEITE